jgi:hypothetical protein
MDIYNAPLYALTRDELHNILDRADTHDPDYRSATFRALKRNEESASL